MEELDLLKKNWNKNENYPKISEEKIYAMLHKNSSSIVKWIFIISVLEILFWSFLSILTNDEEYFNLLELYHIKKPIMILTFLNYGVILYFIYLFYKNYKKVSATDSVKALLENILNTRKTVKMYVFYNLIMIFVLLSIVFVFQVKYDPRISGIIKSFGGETTTGYALLAGIYLIIITAIILFIWLFYKVIYGFLVRRLTKNYNELQKIDY